MLVCFVSMLHILWGLLLLMNGGNIDTAATSIFRHMIPSYEIRAVCYLIGGLLPLTLLYKPGSVVGLFSCLPQQLLLLMSGTSALVAITSGKYADGVLRPHTFIGMDQAVYILLTVLYAFEALDRFHERSE